MLNLSSMNIRVVNIFVGFMIYEKVEVNEPYDLYIICIYTLLIMYVILLKEKSIGKYLLRYESMVNLILSFISLTTLKVLINYYLN